MERASPNRYHFDKHIMRERGHSTSHGSAQRTDISRLSSTAGTWYMQGSSWNWNGVWVWGRRTQKNITRSLEEPNEQRTANGLLSLVRKICHWRLHCRRLIKSGLGSGGARRRIRSRFRLFKLLSSLIFWIIFSYLFYLKILKMYHIFYYDLFY
jgi:hypothetical protein